MVWHGQIMVSLLNEYRGGQQNVSNDLNVLNTLPDDVIFDNIIMEHGATTLTGTSIFFVNY